MKGFWEGQASSPEQFEIPIWVQPIASRFTKASVISLVSASALVYLARANLISSVWGVLFGVIGVGCWFAMRHFREWEIHKRKVGRRTRYGNIEPDNIIH